MLAWAGCSSPGVQGGQASGYLYILVVTHPCAGRAGLRVPTKTHCCSAATTEAQCSGHPPIRVLLCSGFLPNPVVVWPLHSEGGGLGRSLSGQATVWLVRGSGNPLQLILYQPLNKGDRAQDACLSCLQLGLWLRWPHAGCSPRPITSP